MEQRRSVLGACLGATDLANQRASLPGLLSTLHFLRRAGCLLKRKSLTPKHPETAKNAENTRDLETTVDVTFSASDAIKRRAERDWDVTFSASGYSASIIKRSFGAAGVESAMRKTLKKEVENGLRVAITPALSSAEWNLIVQSFHLSPQQARVVRLLLRGKKDKQIAVAMGVNKWTVRAHLTRIFERADVQDRVELILRVFALTHGNKSIA